MKVTIDPNFSIGKYHWNNRVVRHKDGSLAIHEAHYSIPGATTGPCSITTEPVIVYGETIQDIKDTLERMLRCLEKPIIDFETQKEEGAS